MTASPIHLEISQTWDGCAIDPSERVTVKLRQKESDLIVEVDAPFHGDPRPQGPPGPTDALWHHEVVELFIAGADKRYLEIELGPYGHHLVLQLSDIRTPSATGLPIHYIAQRHGKRWTGEAQIPIHLLPLGPHRINATAIFGAPGARRHLSVCTLPGPVPDFHQPAHFPIRARLI
jgi:hypothetical protein